MRIGTGVAFAAFIFLVSGGAANASCGAAFCTLMTDRYAQGAGIPHEGWSIDSRFESIVQDQLRHGTENLEPGDVTDEEAIELKTDNANLVTTLGYGITPDWSVSVRVPLARRDHVHDVVDEDTGLVAGQEQWQFARLGDVQALVRRQFVTESGRTSYAVFGGLKLPTGEFRLTNADGARAERVLQPGSGTTDFVAGVAGRRALGLNGALIGQASITQASGSRQSFKPGRRVDISAGWSHAFSPTLGSVVQLNWQERESDSGDQAEPENSGSTFVTLSPGVTFGIGAASTLYAYAQIPVYQKVTGVQLVPDYALSVGWTRDF